MGKSWFKLILICLLCVGFLVSVSGGVRGAGDNEGDSPPVDGPGVPPGGMSPPRPTDSIGITMAPEPTGTDGYKKLWHCKQSDRTNCVWMWKDGLWGCYYVPSSNVPPGTCFSELIPENTSARDYCFYMPFFWPSFNCFETEDLCSIFCSKFGVGDTIPPESDFEVVYCKPGCRTCEVCRKHDGSLCSLPECRSMFRTLADWYGYAGRQDWCDKRYCPTRCGLFDKSCLKKCSETCVRDFALDNPVNVYHLWMDTYTCLPRERGKIMCNYMCDPRNLGPAPGCDGYEDPGPTPGVPQHYDYWYCDGTDGCVGRNDFLPSECMTECGENGCQYDQACLDAKVFDTEAECQAVCICENRCACSEETCEDDICVDECGNTCLGSKVCDLQLVEPPGLLVGNGRGGLADADDEGRNNICEPLFWIGKDNIRVANFDFTIDNNRGANYIDAIGLAFNNADGEDLIVSVVNLGNGSGLQFVSGDEADNVVVQTTTIGLSLLRYC